MISARVIIEGDTLIPPDFEKGILEAVNKTLAATHKDFEATYATFNHKPTMHIERAKRKGDVIEGSEWTDDENYVRLNEGVPPHPVGRGGQYMSFYPNYTRKSGIRHVGSRPGGRSGVRQRAKGPWMHPGFEDAQFDIAIAEKNEMQFYVNIYNATKVLG